MTLTKLSNKTFIVVDQNDYAVGNLDEIVQRLEIEFDVEPSEIEYVLGALEARGHDEAVFGVNKTLILTRPIENFVS